MKSLIIVVLLLALGGALFFTKPSQKSFEDFYAQQATKGDSGFIAQAFDGGVARQYAQTFNYNDHYLWADMQKNGKTAFSGALGHWFPRDTSAAKPPVP